MKKKKNKRAIGKLFEQIAIIYLKKNGYKVLFKNFYTFKGEIDIVCKKNNEFIFFEVKGGKDYFTTLENLKNSKVERLKKVVKEFFILTGFKTNIYKLEFIFVFAMEGRYRLIHLKNL